MSIFRPQSVYIADSFMIPVGKYDGRHREKKTFFELVKMLDSFLDNGPVPRSSIDAVIVGSQNPFAFSQVDNVAAKIAGILRISGAKSILIDTASSSGASAFEEAYLEVASGRHENVLAIGIQKMSDTSTEKATNIIAGVIDREEAEFGLTMPACGALVAKALMARFNLSQEQWSQYSARLTQRAHFYSARNPNAHFDFELPVEKYFEEIRNGKNSLYFDPMRYHDFCPMSDGLAACLLTSTPREVMVAGVGSGTDIPTIADRETFTTFPATIIALRYALAMAGLTTLQELENRVHINMHDPFNGFGPVNLADFGILDRDDMLESYLDDRITGENGRFPTNLTGGLKGRGHPLGATGMVQVVENHQMIRDGQFEAGLSHSIGGPINNNVVILLERTSHNHQRQPIPYKPVREEFPVLSAMKPEQVTLEALFSGKKEVMARLLSSTTRYNFRGETPMNSLLLFRARVDKKEYRFLIAVDPAALASIAPLEVGEKILLQRDADQVTINDIPVRRFYRKTLAGIMELADTAMKHWKNTRKMD
ncbi:thiolase family protein [Desulfurispirillum indicum]|uniref:Acetyl-CoA acetyltransferase-like protein n=1 Tax=Desulfurispirillum indicum (strain ATCC BAA-1389 / DSM 22839 / S5) TaxID=653733 RepID=E6W517_DESIS|nr:thiolase family protein [Desulfurispirillum indicum]ADU65993.1 acetyl-CoA acetyltransferase-like protein [Desulfurispirillum indicum S5]UCZ57932.1 thiolase family protein [Desulfurispirillum indicum]